MPKPLLFSPQMNRNKNRSFSKNSLIKRDGMPIAEVRIMQISGLTTSQAVSMVKAPALQTGSSVTANSDRAEFNQSAASFSNLVQKASQMPEVRSDVVASYKSRIHSGDYPAQDVIAGLIRLIGGGLMKQVKASSGSSQN